MGTPTEEEPVNVNDGRYVQLDAYLEPEEQLRTAAAMLGCGARDVVRVDLGTLLISADLAVGGYSQLRDEQREGDV